MKYFSILAFILLPFLVLTQTVSNEEELLYISENNAYVDSDLWPKCEKPYDLNINYNSKGELVVEWDRSRMRSDYSNYQFRIHESKLRDYDFKPVTALFTHESNQVYNISFDNGESLGVTYQHPIYSVTAGDWKLAGELEIGEQVLTKEGEATVTSLAKKEGPETVYNLEVQELHNFLVGELGVVVHNNYNIAEAIATAIKAAIPTAFKKYGKCKEFAKALRTQLKANGVQNPKCYVAKVVDSQGKRVNVQLWHNGEKIADNGIHVFTPVNNKVFDNINHNGLETSLLDYTKVDYGGTGVGFETQFAHGYDVVFREVKKAEDIIKIND